MGCATVKVRWKVLFMNKSLRNLSIAGKERVPPVYKQEGATGRLLRQYSEITVAERIAIMPSAISPLPVST